MLQKEVVERMAAQPGDKAYGRLGIMVQYFCRVSPLFEVPPGAFTPRPKVDSAIVRLEPYTNRPIEVKSINVLERVVRTAFNMRRKTIRNALADCITDAELTVMGLDPACRPENLALADYARIADRVADHLTHD